MVWVASIVLTGALVVAGSRVCRAAPVEATSPAEASTVSTATARASDAPSSTPAPVASPRSPAPVPVPAPRVSAAFRSPVRAPEGPHAAAPGEVSQTDEARRLGLWPLPDGSYAYRGQPGERFDAQIKADGTVRLMPESQVQVKADTICAVVVCVPVSKTSRSGGNAPALDRWVGLIGAYAASFLAQDFGGNPNPDEGTPREAMAVSRAWEQTPVGLTPAGTAPSAPTPLASGAGRYGYLPTPNRQMAAFLDRTFEFRLALAVASWKARNDAALHALPAQLLGVWTDASMTYAERRAEILHLWDSLEYRSEDAPLMDALRSEVDADRLRSADAAREKLIEFVQSQLPQRSVRSFTWRELRRFNEARALEVQFWPYRAPRRRVRR